MWYVINVKFWGFPFQLFHKPCLRVQGTRMCTGVFIIVEWWSWDIERDYFVLFAETLEGFGDCHCYELLSIVFQIELWKWKEHAVVLCNGFPHLMRINQSNVKILPHYFNLEYHKRIQCQCTLNSLRNSHCHLSKLSKLKV